jgi:hypothetical protein
MIITYNTLIENTFREILVTFLKYIIIELQITAVVNYPPLNLWFEVGASVKQLFLSFHLLLGNS